jgi:hypothetical protein
MKANFAAKISIATPFVTAIVALFAAPGIHAGILWCVASLFGGFTTGFAFGALSGGLANVLLSLADRCGNQFCTVGLAVAYIILPLAFLAMACLTVMYALRVML